MTNSGRAASWTIRGQSMTLGLQEIEYQHIEALGSGPIFSNLPMVLVPGVVRGEAVGYR